MRIGMVLQTDFPPDIRIEKEIRSLARSHTIALLCSAQSDQPQEESWNDVSIYRLVRGRERLRSQFAIMRKQWSADWRRALERFIGDFSPDALHVHDLPLLGTALDVASVFGLPVVADLHENYPAMLRETKKIPLWEIRSLGRLASRFAVSIDKWRDYEKSATARCDEIIVVIEEAKGRLVSLGLDPQRIHVVGNYEETEGLASRDDETSVQAESDKFTLVYAGGFDATRDLATVVRACALLPQSDFPELFVHLVGGKGRALTQMRQLARKLGLKDRVAASGWMTQNDAEAIIATADVGLVPHVKSPHTDNTIPHKLFQYMWRRLPVIVSDCDPLARIVSESRSGLVYESGNTESLAAAIKELYRDRAAVREMGERAHTAVAEKYNWRKAGQVLEALYARLGGSSQPRQDY